MTDEGRAARLAERALIYHKSPEGEGEYGCPGVMCPGVQRLTGLLTRAVDTELAVQAEEIAQLRREKEQTAWLVALGSSPPRWWTGRGDEWTDSVDGTVQHPANCAIRFARREDAERAIGWLLEKNLARGCKAEEHLWV